jgi:hypothetical protein
VADKPSQQSKQGDEVEAPKQTFAEALSSGKAAVNLNYRFEFLQDDNLDLNGQASTLRTTLSYGTKPFRGFLVYLQAENVTNVGLGDHHNNKGWGDSGNGVTDRPVIADPPVTEMLQAFVEYANAGSAIQIGRQVINLDDQRHVGAVGWRQHWQSHDAVRFRNDRFSDFVFNYAFLDRVHRIFRDKVDTSSHLINARYKLDGIGAVTGYGYFLRYDDEAFYGASRDTIGAEFKGSRAVGGRPPLGGAEAFPMRFRAERTAGDALLTTIPTVFQTVTPQYFDTLGMELRRGRLLTNADREGTEGVAVLGATMARHYFGQEDPIGQRIAHTVGTQFSDWYTVVGIVADARLTDVTVTNVHAVYLSLYQEFPGSTILVRTEVDAAAIIPLIVRTVRELDPERPVENVRTLIQLRADAILPQRLNGTLFGAFATLALAISLVGIAGVLAFSVSQRQREMGIRVALGADRRMVVDLILREGALLTIAGVLAGLFGAIFVAQSLTGLLYGVESSDAATFVAVAFVLIAAGLAGSWLPARRAASVSPMEALRSE